MSCFWPWWTPMTLWPATRMTRETPTGRSLSATRRARSRPSDSKPSIAFWGQRRAGAEPASGPGDEPALHLAEPPDQPPQELARDTTADRLPLPLLVR